MSIVENTTGTIVRAEPQFIKAPYDADYTLKLNN